MLGMRACLHQGFLQGQQPSIGKHKGTACRGFDTRPLRQGRLELLPIGKSVGQQVNLAGCIVAQGHEGGFMGHFFLEQRQDVRHQGRWKLAVVQPQHQRQALRGHVIVFFVERSHHLGQQQNAAQGGDVGTGQSTRVAACIHALVVLQHCHLDGPRIRLGVTDHEHGRDGVGHQVLALRAHHLVARIAPGRLHVQHTQVVQQGCRSQIGAVAFGQATFDAQKHRHHHHLQAVLKQLRALVTHDGEFAGHGRRQWQRTQRRQQTGSRSQGFCQHVGQHRLLRQLLAGRQQSGHAHGVLDGQVAVDRLAQLVLHQPVVQAAVDARALFHQLDAFVGIDRGIGHDGALIGHGGQSAQVMRAVTRGHVSTAYVGVKRNISHARKTNRYLGLYGLPCLGPDTRRCLPRHRLNPHQEERTHPRHTTPGHIGARPTQSRAAKPQKAGTPRRFRPFQKVREPAPTADNR